MRARAALIGILVAQAFAAERQGELPEVTIRAEQKERLKSAKPPLNLSLDETQELRPALETSTSVFRQEPVAWRDRPPRVPKILRSPLAIVPSSTRFSRDPVALFYPLSELKSVVPAPGNQTTSLWRYEVADQAGQRFRSWTGTGRPPEEINFDGKSDAGRMLRPGLPYTPVLTYVNSRGTSTVVGQPVTVEGVREQEADALCLRMDPRVLWESPLAQVGEPPPALTPAGLEILQEAADWIKRLYVQYPFELGVYLPQPEGARAAARVLRDHLAGLLRKPPDEIPAMGAGAPASEARIEIRIKNR